MGGGSLWELGLGFTLTREHRRTTSACYIAGGHSPHLVQQSALTFIYIKIITSESQRLSIV